MDCLVKNATLKFLPVDYDWRLFKAQIWQESRFDPVAVSPVGARGLAQVMPGTWNDFAPRAGHAESDPFDPVASLDVGACYMAWLLAQWFAERPRIDRALLAMASYNAGLGNILKAQRLSGGANDYKSIIARLPRVTSEKSSWETISYNSAILTKYVDLIL